MLFAVSSFAFQVTLRPINKHIRTAISMELQNTADDVEFDTMHRLFVENVSGHVSDPNLDDAISAFRHMLSRQTPPQPIRSTDIDTSRHTKWHQFARYSIQAAKYMCQTEPATTKKKTWTNLQEKAKSLQEPSNKNFQGCALAISFLFGALALENGDDAKAAASAISSTVPRSKPLVNEGKPMAYLFLKAYLMHARNTESLNFTILAQFAKSFQLTDEEEPVVLEQLSANALRFGLNLSDDDETNSSLVSDADDEAYQLKKKKVSGALAFACQIRPFPSLSPNTLVDAAIPYSYYHAAEKICRSAYEKAAKAPAIVHGKASSTCAVALADAILATENLVDTVMEDRLFRLADNIASKLYNEGGKSRYVKARYYHARDTINKVIKKRQIAIIERQVDRVDMAVVKVKGDAFGGDQGTTNNTANSGGVDITMTERPASDWVGSEIRKFALNKLQEEGEIEGARRFAEIWGIEYVYDEKAIQEAEAARRKRYIQFDEVMSESIPELISDPVELRQAYASLFKSPYQNGPIGFDAEWDDDTNECVSIFQIANPKTALLIDIPLLSSTSSGCSALEDTIGSLFDSKMLVVVGFCPRQDLTRLRGSSHQAEHHWLKSTRAVVDAQKLAGKDVEQLNKLGLSRICQHYFGKPLDKGEQCSFWSSRPLSERQRVYAALDAWACAAVYEKLHPIAPMSASAEET